MARIKRALTTSRKWPKGSKQSAFGATIVAPNVSIERCSAHRRHKLFFLPAATSHNPLAYWHGRAWTAISMRLSGHYDSRCVCDYTVNDYSLETIFITPLKKMIGIHCVSCARMRRAT